MSIHPLARRGIFWQGSCVSIQFMSKEGKDRHEKVLDKVSECERTVVSRL